MRLGKLVSFYLIRAVLPYFALSWLILSVILFVQQASRYTEIFFDPNLPASFIWQLTFALIPNVIAFTCPMAVIVGVIIGLSRMQSDNELIAIRNIGVGSFAAAAPVLVLGIFLSLFSIAVNIFGVPAASRAVRMVAVRSALFKLESPIEPGVFNTEVAGFTIYVRGVDFENGTWKNVFVYNEQAKNGTSRLITSRSGRIDSNGKSSELVLENAVISTLDESNAAGNLVSENIGELRLLIKTPREEIAARLNEVTAAIDEMGLVELGRFAAVQQGREATEARIIIVRRIVLSFAPVLFSLLGTFMVLSFPRRGRGFGSLLAFASLLVYFLLTFAGEQLSRSGTLPVIVGGLIAPAVSVFAIAYFAFYGTRTIKTVAMGSWSARLKRFLKNSSIGRRRDILVDLTTGIRDLDISILLLKFYFLGIAVMTSVFVIFTVFELWRFAGSFAGGTAALLKYLGYLLPFTYLQLAPTAAMVAILAVYTIKSRQNEIVIWLSTGQSVYRLIFPCLILMLILGFVNYGLQETVTPTANQKQDLYRRLIRNRGIVPNTNGRLWVATNNTITSFRPDIPASDNGQRLPADCSQKCAVRDVMIYSFAADKAELQSLYRISSGDWDAGNLKITGQSYRYDLGPGGFTVVPIENEILQLSRSSFSGMSMRTNQMPISEISIRISEADYDVERRVLSVALYKRYSSLFLPFVIGLFTAPFALGLERKGRVVSVALGVGLWLVFITITAAFEQLGLVGTLPPTVAVWTPLMAFSMFGIYLIARVRT